MQHTQAKNRTSRFSKTPLAAAIMLLSPGIMAQGSPMLEEVVVTAQKRSENLQDVPISIQALGNESIAQLGIQNFADYAKMLPTVAMTPTLGAGSSFTKVYMRGIATAGDGQATTSQPSVGMYLDEQPITTIQGNLDIHMYDIARVEALAGPQGTLYGASSQAGTIRIITNKPDTTEFSAGYGLEGNSVDGEDTGYTAEGFVNIPLGEDAAIRLVAWNRKDAGYIDNVRGTRIFPGHGSTTADDIAKDNQAFVEDDYNTVDTIGARAALRVNLNEDWSITPTIMGQKQEGEGSWGDDLSSFSPGQNEVIHGQKEFTDDKWYQIGLTIEGRIGNFDVTYAGSYLDREVDGSFDYSDYSYFYDSTYTSGFYADLHFANDGARAVPNIFVPAPFNTADVGSRIMDGAYFTNEDAYTKESHEFRISSPSENRLRGMVGVFWQEQEHDFYQTFEVAGLADIMLLNRDEPNGSRFPDIVYLNSLDRVDKDKAVFASISYDITENLEVTGGVRHFEPEVTVEGFFGFGVGFSQAGWSGTGEVQCADQASDKSDRPCRNVDKGIDESDQIYRLNLTYKINDDHMVYATWSEGYRPGGINRAPNAGEYVSDFLTNWEAGWKTEWFNNSLQFNGAVFFEEWEDFQVSFTGDNAITQVDNGPTAEIYGLESQLLWVPTAGLRLSASFAYYDTELQDDYCAGCNSDGTAWAPEGTKLPVTADFKGNMVARYTFDMASFETHVQGAVAYEGARDSDLNQNFNDIRGEVPSNTIVDLTAGIRNESFAVEFFIKNATDEDAPLFLTSQCGNPGNCGAQNYGVTARPRTYGLRFSQEF
ncbi:MAG: iron complex outermembrane receptor protein [Halioglobus sp.]|jgi:outer membrane receptor protein involved in Fe transport